MMPPEGFDHPSVQRLTRVARALGPLRERIVFIGGAVAPLLQVERRIRNPRATKDVDGILTVATYSSQGSVQQQLRSLGFREETAPEAHAHRWRTPTNDLFDLVPVGELLGSSGQTWDAIAMHSSNSIDVAEGCNVRIPSAAVYLALKWAAYNDRGRTDPVASDDLEDILGLIVCRPSIVEEVAHAAPRVRLFVPACSAELLRDANLEDLLAAHLNGALDPAWAVTTARQRLKEIASLEPNAE